MRAVIATEPGGPEVLTISEVPDPVPGPGEVLIRVAATAVNKADTLQRQGVYPPPPGASDIIGMECSGTVAALGEGVDALVGGRRGVRPDGRRWVRRAGGRPGRPGHAAAGRGRPGDGNRAARGRVHGVVQRVHGGRAAARRDVPGARRCRRDRHVRDPAGPRDVGARVLTTAGTPEKLAACRELGADLAINYREEDFVEVVKEARAAPTSSSTTWAPPTSAATSMPSPPRAGWSIIGMQGGTKGELDLGAAAAQARRRDRDRAARPAGRGEVRDLRVRGRARLAAGGRRPGAARRTHDDAAGRGGAGSSS